MLERQSHKFHLPVMRKEIVEYLQLNKGQIVLDCTIGAGGHASELLELLGPSGRLIGIDQDQEAIDAAKSRLSNFNNYTLVQGNFRRIDQILAQLKVDKVNGMIFDLGISSMQLSAPNRGFSFNLDAPLDMRMDKSLQLSAFDLVNFLPEMRLAEILRKYGQDRWSNRITRAIVRERKKSIIVNTGQLVDVIKRSVPSRYTRIHPATRTFQALRIAVNDELGALEEALEKCIDHVAVGARICVISFHSLEDRIVKHQFRKFAKEEKLRIITKRPLRPTDQEAAANRRARSAKLRVAERI